MWGINPFAATALGRNENKFLFRSSLVAIKSRENTFKERVAKSLQFSKKRSNSAFSDSFRSQLC
ncbi:MAG: hypothetical protein A2909_02905 [Candidatus Tagabacteria bacterium RIFCSPLOWO2_01_FULL_39_11]|uniref:Uncharacterized protein n=1 Tax=Candidatus Tagabacteria bacterium RIFCSPLOWO2_01_FULL_39_11 TaxID=1802295 RepID=A0A1G2LRR8_9BACT|nr:MAG: hypothetical protein A2909_02905 [Candidatus Tagabacteria bacterium RIFCSPLOWO2_01_FULL_39_11]